MEKSPSFQKQLCLLNAEIYCNDKWPHVVIVMLMNMVALFVNILLLSSPLVHVDGCSIITASRADAIQTRQ